MTLKLAAFQHFCARFADAFLTGLSPLTYECGDYSDGTEKLDPDYEPAHWRRSTPEYELRLSAERAAVAATEMAAHLHEYLDLQDSEAVVPTAASASPAPVDGTPPASPGAGLSSAQLDWLEPAVLDVLTGHRSQQVVGAVLCSSSLDGEITCKGDYPDYVEWREHVWDVLRDRLDRASKPK